MMSFLQRWVGLVILPILMCAPVPQAAAQESSILREAVKEVLEIFARKGGTELVEVGGETAVREVVEQVAKESGEQGVKNLIRLSNSYGIDAIRAAKLAPRITTTAMDRVSPEFATGALRGLARPGERAVLERIDSELIPGALEAVARHPGVGAQVVERFGDAGIRASQQLDTDAMIQLARSGEAEKLAALPLGQRQSILTRILDFLEEIQRQFLQ